MHVNISRSRLLINSNRSFPKRKKPEGPKERCNHCGGAIRESGEITACLMCSREKGHLCETCSHVDPSKVAGIKKSA